MDVRVVKELVLRSNGEIREGSIPSPPKCSVNSSVVEYGFSKPTTRVRFPFDAIAERQARKSNSQKALVYRHSKNLNYIRYGLTVRIRDFPSPGPGSTPGIGNFLAL